MNSNEFDKTLVFDQDELKKSNGLFFTDDKSSLQDCNFYIVTVPTPINSRNRPDLSPIISGLRLLVFLDKEDIVVYESTVYPGLTEEICVPILENSLTKV